ncbi:MAG: hypothetical protein ACK5IP_08985 [Paracoccus sp. (in: a-proteobacteria)]
MTDVVLDVINSVFLNLGHEAATNTRAQLAHYKPWEGVTKQFTPPAIPRGTEEKLPDPEALDMLKSMQDGAAGAGPKGPSPMQVMVEKFGRWGEKALRAEGHSQESISRFMRLARRVGKATRGLDGIGGLYDDMTTAGAFGFASGMIIARTEEGIRRNARLKGCVDLQLYISKVKPFYEDVEQFVVLYAMSIGGMPERENSRFAVGFAFQANGIPMTSETLRYLELD